MIRQQESPVRGTVTRLVTTGQPLARPGGGPGPGRPGGRQVAVMAMPLACDDSDYYYRVESVTMRRTGTARAAQATRPIPADRAAGPG